MEHNKRRIMKILEFIRKNKFAELPQWQWEIVELEVFTQLVKLTPLEISLVYGIFVVP